MCSVILPSNVSWQQRLISPVWGFRPLHHVADDVRELSVATLRYSSYDDPVPTLDPAKLPYCCSNVIGAALSTLVLPCRPGTPLLFVCCLVCVSGPAPVRAPCAVLRLCRTCESSSACATLPCPHSGTNEWSLELSV